MVEILGKKLNERLGGINRKKLIHEKNYEYDK